MENQHLNRPRSKPRYRFHDLDRLECRDVPAGMGVMGTSPQAVSAATEAIVDSFRKHGPTPLLRMHVAAGRRGLMQAADFAGPGSTDVSASTPSTTGLTLTPLQRIARYDPTTGLFVPVSADDPNLVGKNIKVLVHGWAPGYLDWVEKAAAAGSVLTWWQTFPGQTGYSPPAVNPGPASAWLLDPTVADGVTVAPTGMAEAISAMTGGTQGRQGSNTVVLAYSWIDDSGTAINSAGLPEGASQSEAFTALNGERLAVALETALGSPSHFRGTIQLIGHSHGSKVATIAAATLGSGPRPYRVAQLTILDSPEATPLADSENAANFNWYFLQHSGLQVGRNRNAETFVENYISEVDMPYNNLVLYGKGKANAANVVDVTLNPLLYTSNEYFDRHRYAPAWYSGSAQPSVNPSRTNGIYWSPLLPGNTGPNHPPANLRSNYRQTWTSAAQAQQFNLAPVSEPRVVPVFKSGALNNGTLRNIRLTDGKPGVSSVTGVLTTAKTGITGYTFSYRFANAKAGDLLTISLGAESESSLEFIMDAGLLRPGFQVGTLSLGDLDPDSKSPLTFRLTSTSGNTKARVVVTNLRQFNIGNETSLPMSAKV